VEELRVGKLHAGLAGLRYANPFALNVAQKQKGRSCPDRPLRETLR
jgi:hypothetical protein